jgi:hypothetical protein
LVGNPATGREEVRFILTVRLIMETRWAFVSKLQFLGGTMKRFSWLLLFACFFLASGSVSAQTMTPDDLIGKWNNQLEPKSTLNIESIDQKTGQIKGSYMSPSGAGYKEFPLIGWVNSKSPVQGQDNVVVLTFSVRWGDIGSISTWAGYLRKGAGGVPTITGQWLLVRPIDEFSWGHIKTGQDIYTPKKESSQRSVPRRTKSPRASGTRRG